MYLSICLCYDLHLVYQDKMAVWIQEVALGYICYKNITMFLVSSCGYEGYNYNRETK